MNKEEDKEFVELPKELFNTLMNMLFEGKKLECSFCGTELTKDNFGLIAKDVLSCNDILCKIKAYDKFVGEKK